METSKIKDEELNAVSGGTQIPYIVKNGDTLKGLAAKYNCTVEQLCRWNHISDPEQILVGQKLIIKF